MPVLRGGCGCCSGGHLLLLLQLVLLELLLVQSLLLLLLGLSVSMGLCLRVSVRLVVNAATD